MFHTAESTGVRPPVRPVTQQVAPSIMLAMSKTNKRGGKTQHPGMTQRFRLLFRPFVRTRLAAEDHVLHFSKSEAGPAAASPKHASGRKKTGLVVFTSSFCQKQL